MGCLTKVKKHSFSNYLSIARGIIFGFISPQRIFEMQIASSSIWNLVTDSFSIDDYRYANRPSIYLWGNYSLVSVFLLESLRFLLHQWELVLRRKWDWQKDYATLKGQNVISKRNCIIKMYILDCVEAWLDITYSKPSYFGKKKAIKKTLKTNEQTTTTTTNMAIRFITEKKRVLHSSVNCSKK